MSITFPSAPESVADFELDIQNISMLGDDDKLRVILDAQQAQSNTVFLLTKNARRKAARVTEMIYDIDDTLTESGALFIPDETLDLLHESRSAGHKVRTLTGRHQRLVDPLFKRHGNPGFDESYTELGAFRVTGAGRREHFLATPEDERNLVKIRAHVHAMMDDLCARYGVVMQPNLGGEHESLDSHVVLQDGVEMSDTPVIGQIMQEIRNTIPVPGWQVRPSSRDTFDIVRDTITKANAMRRHMRINDMYPHEIGYVDDSENGGDVHEAFEQMTRGVVYGRKSKPSLLLHADIAVAGTANVNPLIRFLNRAHKVG